MPSNISASPELLVSIVIPCYRSEGHLARTVTELLTSLSASYRLEIVLVNDGSPDDVQRVIEELARSDERVRYLELATNRGQHFATLRGMYVAAGDVVVTIDDDGQNPPEAVKEVVETLRAGAVDVVYGRFRSTVQSPLRLLASRLNRSMSRLTIGNKSDISITNVRAIRGDLARLVGGSPTAFPYLDALIWRATRKVKQVDVPHVARSAGASTYSFSRLVRLWLSHLTTLSTIPLRVASIGSFAIAFVGFGVGAFGLLRALFLNRAPEGWLSLFAATTFLFSVLFVVLGILATYVGRLYVNENLRGLDWVRSQSVARKDTK